MALGRINHDSETPAGAESDLGYAAKAVVLLIVMLASILLMAAALTAR